MVSTSRMRATRPSPRMVAAAMPSTLLVVGFQRLDDHLALALDSVDQQGARSRRLRPRPAGRTPFGRVEGLAAVAQHHADVDQRHVARRGSASTMAWPPRRRMSLGLGLQASRRSRSAGPPGSALGRRPPCRPAPPGSAAGSMREGRALARARGDRDAAAERLDRAAGPRPCRRRGPRCRRSARPVEKPGRKIRLSISSSGQRRVRLRSGPSRRRSR